MGEKETLNINVEGKNSGRRAPVALFDLQRRPDFFSRKRARAQGSPLVGGPLALRPEPPRLGEVRGCLGLGYVNKGPNCHAVRK